MPIYAYRCESCGHAKDVLQKLSDPLLTACPACGADTFRKQLTAAGFQLKGSGWYVTDFKGGAAPAGAAKTDEAEALPKPADGDKATTTPASTSADAAATASNKAAPAPASPPPATTASAPKPSAQGSE
jgi:putative FmdB family regulatory protein